MSKLSPIFTVLCTIGLFVHTYDLSANYLAYRTVSTAQVSLPGRVPVPGFSICFSWEEIIDITQVQMNIVKTDLWRYHENVSLEQMFKSTPAIDQIFDQCYIQFPNDPRSLLFKGNECLNYFDINKFFAIENLCYRFIPKFNGSYVFHNGANAFLFQGMIYDLILDLTTFNKSKIIRGIVHQYFGYPRLSISASVLSYRYISSNIPLNRFRFTYNNIRTSRLPPPYDTSCSRYNDKKGQRGQRDCYSQCVISRCLNHLNKFPYPLIVGDDEDFDGQGWNFGYLNNRHFENETVRSLMSEFETYCQRICSKPNCEDEISLTNMYNQNPYARGLSFRVYVPRSANVILIYKPNMILLDYLTLVLSCFGTWLGLSILHLNPIELWSQIRRIMASDCENKLVTSKRTKRKALKPTR